VGAVLHTGTGGRRDAGSLNGEAGKPLKSRNGRRGTASARANAGD
jgi:hypothetical protein